MSNRGDSGSEVPAPRVHIPLIGALDKAEGYVYVVTGVMFLLCAVGALGYSLVIFVLGLREDSFAHALITLVNDLLLVVIILEILRTVVDVLQKHVLSLHPFLVIASISATRRILTVGAEIALTQEIDEERFNRLMIDLGVNAGVILAVAIALYLTRIGDVKEDKSNISG